MELEIAMNPAAEPSVSVIIPVYNGIEVIEKCLDSVLAQAYRDFEVIAVDDRSSDGSSDLISRKYPRVRLMRMKRTRGFAGAVNAGIKSSGAEIVVLLNMDTVVSPDWLGPLVHALCMDEAVGLVGSKILSEDGKTLQHAGGKLLENGLPIHIGRGEIDHGQYDRPADVDYLCGASLGFRRRTLEGLGFFDEGYRPLYFEDTDMAFRMRRKGLRVVYIPASTLIHKENISSNGLSGRFYYCFHKSRLRFVFKNLGIKDNMRTFLSREKEWFLKELPPGMRPALLKAYAAALPVAAGAIIKRGFNTIMKDE